MPPIPVHTKSPINAAKASGVTPQTAPSDPQDVPPAAATTTTQPPPTKTTPFYSASGRNIDYNNPPPPQPGAVPRIPQATASSSVPPPFSPEAGPPPPATTAAAQLPGGNYSPAAYPPVPQTGIPPPSTGFNQRGTATSGNEPNRTGPAVLPGVSPYEMGGPSGSGYAAPAPYRSGGNDGQAEEGEGWLDSATKLAKAAGEKLSAAESEVWKRINGEK
ncbi:hypothetical protein QBC35DRAFT_78833 [Podospora australis]|uniref:Uncharacterized protein n=1 Tax=Podospora australis TaxID=1536484 RepID=A0AAN7AM00_9PEZI|nr:hypothetical protein QBC35DRAFT_78833 [Podospora australis]